MLGRASFDDTRRYRYTLHRRWAPGGTRATFCLLNPSTADEKVLDPTLTRCLGFARSWGCHAMEVVNIFALRSTDPKGLAKVEDPIGPGNDAAIRTAANRADLFVLGWGNHGSRLNRAVLGLLGSRVELHCWDITKAGHPKHPLYLAASTPLRPFERSAVLESVAE